MSRKEQAKLTKEKILKTALDLINKKGFASVTVSEICNQAGVAKGTFYVHFESKEDIIKENYNSDMSEYVLKNFDDFILNEYESFAKDNPNKSIKEKIIQFLKGEFMYANHVGYDLICRAYLTNLSDSINGKKNYHFENRQFLPLLKELISEGIQNKEFTKYTKLDDLIVYIESFCRGIMTTWCLSKGNFDIVDIGEKHIRTLLVDL
ncbi:TetR/AcrR family transcriptional regulator [Cetobacterium sp.]|uniref:TetR/AcrR family transcriptional regulator n=1 Tax=Cetobacterium sp. TaxID=2071632 RepID=UPI003F364477